MARKNNPTNLVTQNQNKREVAFDTQLKIIVSFLPVPYLWIWNALLLWRGHSLFDLDERLDEMLVRTMGLGRLAFVESGEKNYISVMFWELWRGETPINPPEPKVLERKFGNRESMEKLFDHSEVRNVHEGFTY